MNNLNLILVVVCVLTLCTLMFSVSPSDAQTPCTGSPAVERLPHPTDCGKFYVCLGAQHFLRSCKPNTSWQPEKRACVHKGSPDDICPCKNRQSGGIFRHPTKCAQYYNCSARATHINWAYPGYVIRGQDYLDECHFPQLFSMLSGKCENYTQVDCGRRIEAKNPCDYRRNQCSGRCASCEYLHPDCTGLPDGPNVWRWRRESQYYCICQNGRLISTSSCPGGIFHPTQRICVDYRSYSKTKP